MGNVFPSQELTKGLKKQFDFWGKDWDTNENFINNEIEAN